jgi:hypothetical protein
LKRLAHPTRFERVTFAFGGQKWVLSRRFLGLPQLSYLQQIQCTRLHAVSVSCMGLDVWW